MTAGKIVYGGKMKYICGNCIGENYLKKYINGNGFQDTCSYCQKKEIVMIFDEVIDIIKDGFLHFYEDPYNEHGREYVEYAEDVGCLYEAADLVSEYIDCEKAVFDDIVSRLCDQSWCKKEWTRFDTSEENKFTWETFKKLTKHELRFFFNLKKGFCEDEYVRYTQPNDMLKTILNISNRLKLFTILKKGTIIYRARAGEYLSKDDLCSPAPNQSIFPNRFNPAGISMFYGSDDINTSLLEIHQCSDCSVGQWELLQDLLIYDLTKFQFKDGKYYYNKFPSIFDDEKRKYYHDYKFILDFASDMSKKVTRNKSENIDYIPTQIITEYLKFNKKGLKGICYYSSINGQKNYCLFLDKETCLNGNLLEMIKSSYIDKPICLIKGTDP
jgi:hypothetical protein